MEGGVFVFPFFSSSLEESRSVADAAAFYSPQIFQPNIMPRLKKPKVIIDEEAIAAPPEQELPKDFDQTASEESLNGDSAPFEHDSEPEPVTTPSLPQIPFITPLAVKNEVLRVVPLLVDAIRFLQSKKPVTPTNFEIIRKRLDSAALLISTTKGLDA